MDRPSLTPFAQLEPYAGDPILHLSEQFEQDTRLSKVNLSIGIYFDGEGRVRVPAAVREAETRLLAQAGSKAYLPIEGAAAMRSAVQALLFGAQSAALKDQRVVTLQSVGSSGALKVAADFMKRWLRNSSVYVSDPTWENHRAVFEGAGLAVSTYPYYDALTGGVDYDAMMQAIAVMPARSIVLLHACCHNPTGADLSTGQWTDLVALLADRGLIAWVDLAYQGFGDNLEDDALAIRLLADAGVPSFIVNSFSKNMGLYGERAGALSVICASRNEANLVLGQLKATIRRNYSSPPLHAAGIVSLVLTDAALHSAWVADVARMRDRIADMRHKLHAALSERLPHRNFGFLLRQRGMFSYTNLSPTNVKRLRDDQGVYLVGSGRLCLAGLNDRNVARVADAIAAVAGG